MQLLVVSRNNDVAYLFLLSTHFVRSLPSNYRTSLFLAILIRLRNGPTIDSGNSSCHGSYCDRNSFF